MALWQFITFVVLLGALFIYVSVIARGLGRTQARLNGIEESLLSRDTAVGSAPPKIGPPNAPLAEAKPDMRPDVSNETESRGAYLTIRDLRARGGQLSSHATRSSGQNLDPIPERRDASKTMRELATPPPNTTPERWVPIPFNSRRRDNLGANGEPLNLPSMRVLSRDASASADTTLASLVSQDAPTASHEPASLVAVHTANENEPPVPASLPTVGTARAASAATDMASSEAPTTPREEQSLPDSCDESSAAKKARDTVLFLSAQRRRRRARLGY